MKKLEIKSENILKELSKIAFFDISEILDFTTNGDFTVKPIRLWSEAARSCIKSISRDFIKESEKDVKYFTDEEIKSLLNLNRFEEIYPILVIALNMGMRIGEIFGLCWDCINFEKN